MHFKRGCNLGVILPSVYGEKETSEEREREEWKILRRGATQSVTGSPPVTQD